MTRSVTGAPSPNHPRNVLPTRRRISHDAAGLSELTALFAAHGAGRGTVKIAIETERGLLVRPRNHDHVVVALLGIGEE